MLFPLEFLARTIKKDKALYSLSISGCEMSSSNLLKIVRAISKNSILEDLDLSLQILGSQKKCQSPLLKEIYVFICSNKQLLHIDVSYCMLIDSDLENIVQACKKSDSLMSIHLGGNSFNYKCKNKCLQNLNGVLLKTQDIEKNYFLWNPRNLHDFTWYQSDQCFLCDHWQHVVLLFSEEFAEKFFKVLPNETKGDSLCFSCEIYNQILMNFLDICSFAKAIGIENLSRNYLLNSISSHSKFEPFYAFSQEQIDDLPPKAKIFLQSVPAPGKHNCIIYMDKKTCLQELNIPDRKEEIRAYNKPIIANTKQRIFMKEQSVFQNSCLDTPNTLIEVISYDLSKTKIKEIVTSSMDYKGVYSIFKENIQKLENEFISLAVRSKYPRVLWNDFEKYCYETNIVEKNFFKEVVNSGKTLCRYNFFEELFIIASNKYKEEGLVETYTDAFEKLIKVLSTRKNAVRPDKFRKTTIWTIQVDDILRNNIDGIKKVYIRYSANISKCFGLDCALNLIQRDCKIKLEKEQILKAFAQSKIRIPLDEDRDYCQLTFEEFLEFIVRIADSAFKNGFKQLDQKIDIVLINMLGIIHEIKYPAYCPEEASDEEQ